MGASVPFHMLMGVANRQAHRRGDITDEQFKQMKAVLRDPEKSEALEEAAYNHGVKLGVSGIKGVPEGSVNWGTLWDFIVKYLPLLFQLLPLFLAENPTKVEG